MQKYTFKIALDFAPGGCFIYIFFIFINDTEFQHFVVIQMLSQSTLFIIMVILVL